MKRFWKDVLVAQGDDGWTVALDGRQLKTPERQSLSVPTEALAEAIAREWRDSPDTIDPRLMPLTGLANAAIDRVEADRLAFADGLSRYAQADLACYRADGPSGLVSRQEESWDALLGWARRRFDVDFAVTTGVTHVSQPAATIERLSHAVSALGPFQLAGLSPLVTIGGSLVGGLAVLEEAKAPEEVWEAVSLDDQWQLERWGSDAEAEAALANRKADFLAAARFLRLIS